MVGQQAAVDRGAEKMSRIRPWWSPAFLAFAAVAWMAVIYVNLFIHEVLGHGLVNWALGGRFYAFFINPFGGAHIGTMPGAAGWREDVVLAGGTVANLITGWCVWHLAARARGRLPLRVFLLLLAGGSLVNATLYAGLDPLVQLLAGRGGDIGRLLVRWRVSAVPVALLGTAAAFWISVRLCSLVLAVLDGSGMRARSRGEALALLAAVVIPGSMLHALSFVLAAPYLSSVYVGFGIASLATFAIFYGAAAYRVAWRWQPPAVLPPCTADPRSLWKGTVIVTVAIVAALVFFGPTDRTARAMIVAAPGGETFRPDIHLLTRWYQVHLVVRPDLRADARVSVRVARDDSPLARSLAAAATAAGPDAEAMRVITQLWFAGLRGAVETAVLPRAREGDWWLVGSRLRLEGSQALTPLEGGRWRMVLEYPYDVIRGLDRVEVRLLPGLRVVGVAGLKPHGGALVWDHADLSFWPPGPVRLMVEFARDR